MRLRGRIEALEQRRMPVRRWHRIVVGVGETMAAVRARYELDHGAIGEDDGLIVRTIVG